MTIKVAINGMGRIGRSTLAAIIESGRSDIEVVSINAPAPIETLVHLMKYDSVHGRFPGDIKIISNNIDVGRGLIDMQATYNPAELNWEGIDVLLECTGVHNSKEASLIHLENGAKKVLLSAPGKNVDKTVVFGVNHNDLTSDDLIVSNASCTTNCLAPVVKVLNDAIGIENGIMTTIHSYTGDQPTLDKKHIDLYRSGDAEDIDLFDLDRDIKKQKIILIEWPEKLFSERKPDVEIYLKHSKEMREVSVKIFSN